MEELVPVAGSFRGENDAQVTIHFDQLRWRKQRQWVVMWPRPRLSGARVFERLRMRKVWYTLGHRHAVVSLVASLALPTLLLQEEFVPCPSRFLLRNSALSQEESGRAGHERECGMQTKPYPEQKHYVVQNGLV